MVNKIHYKSQIVEDFSEFNIILLSLLHNIPRKLGLRLCTVLKNKIFTEYYSIYTQSTVLIVGDERNDRVGGVRWSGVGGFRLFNGEH